MTFGITGPKGLATKVVASHQFWNHHHLISNTSRSFYHTSRPSQANFVKILQSIFYGDDHVNPKKLLERRYLYYTLLATKFRSLRLEAAADAAVDADNRTDHVDELYERATEELDAKGLDRWSNVQLRHEMQVALQPQVLEIFEAFSRVDERLGIGTTGLQLPDSDQASKNRSINPFFDFDWEPFHHILESELEKAGHGIEEERSLRGDNHDPNNHVRFLERKQDSLETLLHFHGRSTRCASPLDEGTNEDGMDALGTNVSLFSDASMEVIRCYQTVNMCRSALIREELGYSILSLKSLIPGAGRGTFIDGRALAGTLVAFQPGEIWPKEHLMTTAADVMDHFADDDEDCLISLRFDDYVVDSRPSPVTVLTHEGTLNPWALGHVVNHPSAGTLPNCQSTALNFTEEMELDDLERYVPNIYARQPGWKSRFFFSEKIVMHGLCLVARRDVGNEELVYDYRLQSEEPPRWYSIVHYGDDMDDEQVVFFRDDWMRK